MHGAHGRVGNLCGSELRIGQDQPQYTASGPAATHGGGCDASHPDAGIPLPLGGRLLHRRIHPPGADGPHGRHLQPRTSHPDRRGGRRGEIWTFQCLITLRRALPNTREALSRPVARDETVVFHQHLALGHSGWTYQEAKSARWSSQSRISLLSRFFHAWLVTGGKGFRDSEHQLERPTYAPLVHAVDLHLLKGEIDTLLLVGAAFGSSAKFGGREGHVTNEIVAQSGPQVRQGVAAILLLFRGNRNEICTRGYIQAVGGAVLHANAQ
ncbi:uncharacterized protein PG986_002383 [Apiospora aurea]|uniref:Uncharacterized protein n=1 Tax=Apiospora aurea TaxID=335848 RepID=A0ABR1QZG1_9PEZI